MYCGGHELPREQEDPETTRANVILPLVLSRLFREAFWSNLTGVSPWYRYTMLTTHAL
jgi:hypothetical protein